MTQSEELKSKTINRLKRKLARETKAREEAEKLLEEKSAELYDLTRRTQDLAANLQTAERDAAIASLGQTIAHDLNNLITAISGYALLIQSSLEEGTESFQRAQRIGRAASQAASVVSSLDSIISQRVNWARLNLSELIETNIHIIDSLRPKDIQLDIEIEPQLNIIGDDIAISRSLVNIIKNAFEAMPKSGRVLFRAARSLDINVKNNAHHLSFGEPAQAYQAIIEITDTGHGMNEHTLEAAFTRSFSTKHSSGLTGLGLQSVKTLAEQNLAFVTVQSSESGGTQFCIYLKKPPHVDNSVTERSAPTISRGTIFIIDDDPLVGDMLQATLTHMGHEALWYEYPLQALKDIHETPPALIITDFNMPEMSGREFAEQANNINSNIPIIVYSGQAAAIPQNTLYSAVLKKPITPEALQNAIKGLIIT